MLLWLRTLPLLCLGSLGTFGATFISQGTTLTVSTPSLQVTFNGADVVAVTNALTGESYLRNPSSATQLDLALVQPPSAPLTAAGSWTVDSTGSSATLTFTDSNRTVTVSVSTDPATEQIIVDLDGQAKQGGVERLVWGLTGFDMTAGQFVLPADGGLALNGTSLSAAGTYNFYHAAWEAPFILFQGARGGVNIYSTDTKSLCKDLAISTNFRQTANAAIQVEAPGPWKSATEAGPIEWRLAPYSGDWQSGARIYRDWHNSALPPAPLTGARSWANNIRTVIEYADPTPYQNSTLDSLAAVMNPALSSTTRAWQASDFVNGQMPVQLDGVSVSVNGQPAFVEYISPTQVNILTPLDSPQGTVPITVTSGGVTSAPLWIPMQTLAPGFFLFSGSQYVAATHAAGNLLGPQGLYPGATAPASPGEVVTVYGGGFGQATPALVSGSVVQYGTLPPPLPVFTVSGIAAEVRFAGVTAPGLYQFNVVVPLSAPDGDNTIEATYGGATTQGGALISVQR